MYKIGTDKEKDDNIKKDTFSVDSVLNTIEDLKSKGFRGKEGHLRYAKFQAYKEILKLVRGLKSIHNYQRASEIDFKRSDLNSTEDNNITRRMRAIYIAIMRKYKESVKHKAIRRHSPIFHPSITVGTSILYRVKSNEINPTRQIKRGVVSKILTFGVEIKHRGDKTVLLTDDMEFELFRIFKGGGMTLNI